MDAEQNRSDLNRPREGRWVSWYLLFIFIALTIGIGATGYYNYNKQKKNFSRLRMINLTRLRI
jgi:hypothetical protein